MTTRRRMLSLALHAFLIGYSVLTLAPFVWAVLTSFKSLREITLNEQLLPTALNLDAYRVILSSDFQRWFFNSLGVSVIVTVASLFTNTLAGYALARMQFRGRQWTFQSLLFVIMIPASDAAAAVASEVAPPRGRNGSGRSDVRDAALSEPSNAKHADVARVEGARRGRCDARAAYVYASSADSSDGKAGA